MSDALQQSLHAAAAHAGPLNNLAVFCANDLIVLVGLAFAWLAWTHRAQVTRAVAVKMAVSGVLALLLVQVLGPTVHDPRPYIAEGYTPLAHVASDNGFPSDHTLVTALLTGWIAWILPATTNANEPNANERRRWLPAFGLCIALVMLGRLAIGAHHTLDVLGSLVIVALSLGVAGLVRLGDGDWQKPVLRR